MNGKLGTRTVIVDCVYEVLRAGALVCVGDLEVLWYYRNILRNMMNVGVHDYD